MTVPSDRWLTTTELRNLEKKARTSLIDLANRGVLVADPAAESWADLGEGEELLEKMQWHDLAAVYQSHTGWKGVLGDKPWLKEGVSSHETWLDGLRKLRGELPPHFVERDDAKQHVPLRIPAMDGPFFAALLSRRTTRAYRTEQSLPVSALELMLYAVFGTHGIKFFAKDIAAIKRTSPSGGALHPIEAYVLAINVDGIPVGMYHYETGSHSLALLESMERRTARDMAGQFTAGQKYFADAHVLVIHVARFDRSFWKYAQHRKAYKAVLLDSAHLSQTLYLTAAHLGLGAFYTAAINDVDIGARLRLKPLREAAVAISGFGIADSGHEELHFVPDPYRPARMA